MAQSPNERDAQIAQTYGDTGVGRAASKRVQGRDPGSRVNRMRATLRKNGYDVKATGAMTHRMLGAWHDYRTGGHPHRWNAANPRTSDKVPADVAKGVTDVAKNVQHIFSGDGGGVKAQVKKATDKAGAVTKVQAKAAVHSKALTGDKRSKVGGSDIPGVKMGNPNVNKLIPAAMSGKIAGLTFDPQIREALLQQERGKRDTAQAQADIGNWFGQASASQAIAAQRDTAAAGAGRTSVANELNSVLQSLGGSRGAGVVGASGLADLTELAAQGTSQEQYNADLAPIIKGQEAGQHSRQQALASQAAEKLGSQLIDLRGQKGQATAAALADILTRNNAARQANFGNRSSIASQQLAAKTLGLNAENVRSEITARTAQTKQNAKALSLKTAQGTPSWNALSGKGRQDAINSALAPYFDPQTGGLLAGHDPNDVLNQARQTLRSYGYTSARRAGFKGPGVNPRSQAQILGLLHSTLSGMQARSKSLGATAPIAP